MATPAEKFTITTTRRKLREQRDGPEWVARKVSTVGVVCVSWQQVSVTKSLPSRLWKRPCVLRIHPDMRRAAVLPTLRESRPGAGSWGLGPCPRHA